MTLLRRSNTRARGLQSAQAHSSRNTCLSHIKPNSKSTCSGLATRPVRLSLLTSYCSSQPVQTNSSPTPGSNSRPTPAGSTMVPQSTDDSSRVASATRKQLQQQEAPSLVPLASRPQAIHPDILDVLYTPEAIRARTAELGAEIAAAYSQADNLTVLGVLTGAFVFCSDLVRAIHPVPANLKVDFIRASSYGSGTESAGSVKVSLGADPARVKDKHVLLVEDIVDTALTITTLKARLVEAGAASVRVATLLDKHERRQIQYTPDFVGFTCPNQFVVGYGLDFDDKYRSLPYIGVLRPEMYAHLGL